MPSVCANAEGLQTNPVKIRLLLDCAATSNFISVSATKHIRHEIIEDNISLKIRTLHGQTVTVLRKISFYLVNSHSSWKRKIYAYVIDKLMTLPPIFHTTSEIMSNVKSSKIQLNEQYPRLRTCTVDLLIGITDMIRISGKKQIYLNDDLVLLSTRWGYVLMGSEAAETPHAVSHSASFTKTEILTKQLERMWNLEPVNV